MPYRMTWPFFFCRRSRSEQSHVPRGVTAENEKSPQKAPPRSQRPHQGTTIVSVAVETRPTSGILDGVELCTDPIADRLDVLSRVGQRDGAITF